MPRELEKLLSGLIEKLEWVQLTHTDHTALAHLEDRIATLVKRLDASDARLGLLEGVERGLADLLVYIEQLRDTRRRQTAVAKTSAAASVAGCRDRRMRVSPRSGKPTARKQAEIRLEDVHGTVEHVVDRWP